MQIASNGLMALIIDPAGAVFGVWQPIEFIGAQAKDEFGALAWAETYSRDAAKAGSFYAELFGLTLKPLENMPSYSTLHLADGTTVAGIRGSCNVKTKSIQRLKPSLPTRL
jgi:uncharacterized protein